MLKNYGFGLSKSLSTGSNDMYAKVYIQDGKAIVPTGTFSAVALKAAAPWGVKPECKYVQIRTSGGNTIHAQLADSPVNRPYGASWSFVDAELAAYLNGTTVAPVAPKPAYAYTPVPKPLTFAEFMAKVEAELATVKPMAAPKPAFTPVVAPKTTMTPGNFGNIKSLAGTGVDYVPVFVQDGKIVTPTAIMDATALKNACSKKGGIADRKFVMVRLNGGNNIHAQLPDEDTNRPYGTSFDFTDATLAAYLRG